MTATPRPASTGQPAAVEIPLTRGFVAIVDADMAARIIGMGKWLANPRSHKTYAQKTVRRADGRRTTIGMHNVVADAQFVDHINGDGLDNRRANLRPADHTQNARNRNAPRHNMSGYKGVYWNKARGCWRSQIMVDGRRIYLGSFADVVEAAKAYDGAAARHHGEFAGLNFPEEHR